MNKNKIVLSIAVLLLLSGIVVFGYLFYPQQSMSVGEPVEVTTIQPEKYHHDCLHPCIRYNEESDKYYMAQSPYYGWNNKVENPMLYVSDDYSQWHNGNLIADTPEKGYNSDPCICITKDRQIIFLWRECHTPLCDSLKSSEVTVGGVIANRGVIAVLFAWTILKIPYLKEVYK